MKSTLEQCSFVTSSTLPVVNRLGLDSLDLDPLLLRDAVEDVFGISKVSQKLFDRINCGYALIGTTAFTGTIEGFLTSTAIMNGKLLDSTSIPFCSFRDCAWSIWEYININGDMDADDSPTEQFSPDIIKYIQEAGRLNGVVRMPAWMQFAQAPDNSIPDMSEDADVFRMYMERQDDYIQDVNTYVNTRQTQLMQELEMLKSKGFIG